MALPLPGPLLAHRPVVRPLPLHGVLRALLAAPLAVKLAGAQAIVVGATLGVLAATHQGHTSLAVMLLAVGGTLAGGMLLLVALVTLALRPLREIEATAHRVTRGDTAARVPASPLADADLARIALAMNTLLDTVDEHRERVGRLALETLQAEDRERSRLAHELHDGVAQTLAAAALHASVAAAAGTDPRATSAIAVTRDLLQQAMAETRGLAHAMHPQALASLGLAAALRGLARHAAPPEGLDITVVASDAAATVLDAAATGVCYRLAQEALGNAVRHGQPRHIELRLDVVRDTVRLAVIDDGRGFDVAAARRTHAGLGLFAMHERVALLGGRLHVASRAGAGTAVIARLPVRR